ncbi:MAG TPA: thioredoxin domain-containing protein [Terracidiphilus sp.]|jgi:protein-disulfide isomerase|nr:thioredoxin domain-containing protein [Terracidiphilus sp.]
MRPASLLASAALAATALFALPAALSVRAAAQETTQVHNTAPLHPPAGARVAIIEFEDLECPDCARANPLLKQAAEQYKIPWVRHDFPLPQHDWSFQAAVNARWFDTHSKRLGDEYRDAVFAHQDEITVITNGTYDGSKGLPNLHAFTEKFAADHKLALPFVIDPQGKLAALVKADYALGQSVGLQHTPTIWVATNQTNGAPFVEVVDRTKLYSMIDTALEETKGSAPTRAAAHHGR